MDTVTCWKLCDSSSSQYKQTLNSALVLSPLKPLKVFSAETAPELSGNYNFIELELTKLDKKNQFRNEYYVF